MKLSKTAVICIAVLIIAALTAGILLAAPRDNKAAGSQEYDEKTASEEDIPVFSSVFTSDGRWKDVKASDYVSLCDYKGIKLDSAYIKVTEEDLINEVPGLESVSSGENDSYVEIYDETYGWKTVEEMRKTVTETLEKDRTNTAIYEYILENSSVSELPQVIKDYQKTVIKTYYTTYYYSLQQSMTWNEFLKQCGYDSEEQIYESSKDKLDEAVVKELIYQAVAEDAKLNISDEDIDSYMNETMPDADRSEIEQEYGNPYIANLTLIWKTQQFLKENAVYE